MRHGHKQSRWLLVLSLRSVGVLGSPHEVFQSQIPILRSHQDYGVHHGVGSTRRLQEQTCEQVHSASSWEQMRIGFELIDVQSVSAEKVNLVQDTLMARAVAYWSSTLQVRRAQGALKMDRVGSGCFKYAFDTDFRCQGLQTPTCGAVTIPAKYLKARRACSESCVPSYACSGNCVSDNTCACDVDLWSSSSGYCCSMSPGASCPTGCSLETAVKVGNGTTGGFVCEANCVQESEGVGAENEDLHIFVTIQDSTECQNSDALLAFAISCAVDQCDRPIFGTINFCLQKLAMDDTDMLVSTAIHELAHVLVFSNAHFQNFRYSNGSPMIPRQADDQTRFPNEIFYTCSSAGYQWDVSNGNMRYVDISPTIVNSFSERGYDCQCPIGKSTLGAGCFYPSPPFLQIPSCVVRMVTPTVLAEARNFFDCPTLEGAELENQEGNGCSIIGSHWEQRVFAGEIMSPVATEKLVNTYVSRVSLAVFEDSGWYKPDMSAADPVVKGVHWGYKQGCNFATGKCLDNDTPVSKVFCSDPNAISCSLDRKSVKSCEIGSAYASLPAVYSYTSTNRLGGSPEMDYCPHFAIGLTNRVCTNTTSITSPYTNVNFMREVFSSQSRCFLSTLHADAPRIGGGSYVAPSDEFTTERPVCYHVECAADTLSYSLKVADLATNSMLALLGTCFSAGQTLTMQGGGGSVTCADPAEVCSDITAKHTLAGQSTSSTSTTELTESTSSDTTTTTTTLSTGGDGGSTQSTQSTASTSSMSMSSTTSSGSTSTSGNGGNIDSTSSRGSTTSAEFEIVGSAKQSCLKISLLLSGFWMHLV